MRARKRITCWVSLLLAMVGLWGLPATAQWTDGQNGEYVVGQSNWTSSTAATTQNGLSGPASVAVDVTNSKLYVADYTNHRILRYSYPISSDQPNAELVFGQSDYVSGSANAGGLSASALNGPAGIAVDSTGRLWVTDSQNHRVVWYNAAHSDASNKPDADGVLGQADFASGSANRGGSAAQNTMSGPKGLALDGSGNLFVADTSNNRVLRFDSASGKSDGANADGVLGQSDYTSTGSATTQGGMNAPGDCALDGTTLFVADTSNNRVLRFDSAASKGNGANADGVLGQIDFTSSSAATTASGLSGPSGVICDAGGRLYVSDPTNTRVVIFIHAVNKADGASADNVLGAADFTTSSQDTTQAGMHSPSLSAVDNTNNKLVVADSGNNRVAVYAASSSISNHPPVITEGDSTPVTMSEDGSPTAFSLTLNATDDDSDTITWSIASLASHGSASAGGTGASKAISYTPHANFSGADSFDVQVSDGNGGTDTITVNVTVEAVADNPEFVDPSAVSFMFTWGSSGTGDGQFNSPCSMATDSSGNVYVADTNNHRIQKFDRWGSYLLQWGGFGTGDGQFNAPYSIAIDSSDNVYVADTQNDRIQKFDSSGGFLTKWGTFGTGDGQMDGPFGIAVDSSDFVYITDTHNDRIQKFNSSGTFQMKFGSSGTGDGELDAPDAVDVDSSGNIYVAGSVNDRVQKFNSSGTYLLQWGSTGTGQGQFDEPCGVAVDPLGDVYVADRLNARIQKFDASGTFILEWGSFGAGYGQFKGPEDVRIDSDSGNIYVADRLNRRIQQFAPDAAGASVNVTMSEDGSPTAFSLTLQARDVDGGATITWSISSPASDGTASVSGTGIVKAIGYTPDPDFNGSDSFVVQVSDGSNTDTITVNVTVEAVVDDPTVTAWPTASAIAYGQALSASTLSGGTASVSGTFTFDAPGTTPDVGTYSAAVTFTPDDLVNYNTVAGSVDVTVTKATPSVTAWPTASAITYGDALSASTLSGGTASVSGTFAFDTPATTPDAGTYSAAVTFTPDDTVHYNTVAGSVDVTVNKETPTVTAWPTASAITYGDALSASTLSGGTASVAGTFSFDAPATTPDAGTYSAAVTFTPSDTSNYETVAGSVDVTVNKATPTVTAWPTASAITYGDALSASTLSGGTASVAGAFSFDAPAATPDAGTYSAAVTFTPSDTSNNETVAGSVDVTVNKATPTVTAWPTASAITYGQALSVSTLSGGTASVAGTFAFDAPATTPDAGTYSAAVTFTPSDTSNNETVAGSVDVTVSKATPTVTAWPTASAITYGQALSASTLSGGTASVAGTFAFDAPATTPDAGTYSAATTFTPSDTSNNETVAGSVNVTVNKASPTVTAWPTPSVITYGQALSASTLSGGTASVAGTFAFDAPAATPNAGTYSAAVTFTPSDTSNNETVAGSVNVTVNKAAPTVTAWPAASAITYGQALSASTLSGGTTSAAGTFSFDAPATTPNAGTYSAAVTFTPSDTSNYTMVSGSVNVTVNKAAPTVTAWPTASAITYGQALSASTLSGGTPSVAGTFAFDAPATTPSVGTHSVAVTFTPDDAANYTSVAGTVSVTVEPTDVSLRIVEGPLVTSVTDTAAFVEWRTNNPSDSQVDYGETMAMTESVANSVEVLEHRMVLTGLSADTTYYLQVTSSESAKFGSAQSDVLTFTTLDAADTAAPVLLAGPAAANLTETEVLFTWVTDEPATSTVSVDDGGGPVEVTVSTLTTGHALHVSGLTGATTYTCVVSSVDLAGNGPTESAAFSHTTLDAPDVTVPEITEGPLVVDVYEDGFVVRWLTDEPADSVVEYGSTVAVENSAGSGELVTEHVVTVSGLASAATYHFRASSMDASGNGPTTSPIFTVETEAAADTTAPVITAGPTVIGLTDTTATVYWETNERSDSVVEYGVGGAYDLWRADAVMVFQHQVTLVDLTPGASYDFRVSSADAAGNIVVSTAATKQGESSFQTASVPDTTAPVLETAPSVVGVSDTSAVLYWHTDELADGFVDYGLSGGTLDASVGHIVDSLDHVVVLTGLAPNTAYDYQVRSTDTSDNGPTTSTVLSFSTLATPDEDAPTFVDGPAAMDVTTTTAAIEWETDEFATTQVYYGTESGNLNMLATITGMRGDHRLVLASLDSAQTYYFVAVSLDESQNEVQSTEGEFKTTAARDVNLDGNINAIDVQLVINEALGIDTGYDCDVNGNGSVEAVDIQLVINAALGLS